MLTWVQADDADKTDNSGTRNQTDQAGKVGKLDCEYWFAFVLTHCSCSVRTFVRRKRIF